MIDSDTIPQFSRFLDWLSRHLVGFSVAFRKGDQSLHQIYSSFVLSVEDEWVLITAGHCLDEIHEMEKAGYEILGAELIDALASNAKHVMPIPINLSDAEPVALTEEGLDCGVLRLSSNQRQLLEANSKMAIDEQAWDKQPERGDLYLLVGIPSENTREDKYAIYLSPTAYVVTEVAREAPFEKMPFDMFYGRVHLGDEERSIVGTSGGPILVFRALGGESRYWLHALQSTWNSSDRRIAAVRMRTVGLMIKHVIGRAGGARSLRNSRHRTLA